MLQYTFFLSLKLHKLPYFNLFTGFNNILKKIPFSCYIKCNTSHFKKKKYIYFRKRIFQFFSFHFHVLIENEGKTKEYIDFFLQLIFFSQNCINNPLLSVFRRIYILSKKDHLLQWRKKEYMPFHEKSSFSPKKWIFRWFSANFIVFIKK